MKKGIAITFFTLIFYSLVFSQTCLPSGMTFSNQSQIDDFLTNNPGCTQILGNVNIDESSPGNITNLNGFSSVTSIGGYLRFGYLTGLSNMTGLENLTSIGTYFNIEGNTSITSLNGLNNLNSIGSYFTILYNSGLTDLSALSNLISIGSYLRIHNNSNLPNLIGLEGITSISGGCRIFNNGSLSSLSGLMNLNSISSELRLDNNDALLNFSGLDNLISIGGQLRITGNASLVNLFNLGSIDYNSISSLIIQTNGSLSMCEAQSICDYIDNGGSSTISGNATGCNNVTEVETACNALPVELVEFSGISSNSFIQLFWVTASELNNRGFEIQKSNNGRYWEIIDFVEGAGTISEVNEYQFQDFNPFSGINYYRLKQIDYDGVFEYSKVIAVEYNNSEKEIQVFPNPSNRLINIQIDNPSNQRMNVRITDNLGRKIWESELIEGKSNWRKEMEIDGNGIYFITAQIGNEIFYERVIILNEK